MTMICIAVYIEGIVQGVGFRHFTCQKALALGLTGEVRNLNDGRVEIIACGQQQSIESLLGWLKQGGPKSARINHIATEPRPVVDYGQFKISY